MRQVEQARPLADRPVLLEDPAVLDGHEPAGEVDEPGAECAVALDQRGDLDRIVDDVGHGQSPDPAVPTLHVATSRSATRWAARSTSAALGLERQDAAGLGELEPADLVELMVVIGEVAAGRLA